MVENSPDLIAKFASRAKKTLGINQGGGKHVRGEGGVILDELDPELMSALEEAVNFLPGGSGGTISQDTLRKSQGRKNRFGR